jgi:maltose alpha-D-glucosyltransferase/alpha-amylase
MGFADRADEAITQAGSWITNQRWYGDKARTVASLSPYAVRQVAIDSLDAALVIVHITYDRGPESRYFVPLVASSETTVPEGPPGLRDALADPEFLSWFVRGFSEDRSIDGDVHWHWRRLGDDFPDTDTVNLTNARMISAEQSNTSVVFDDRFIGKVFRRLQPGVNPDLEIGEFLSTGDRFEHVPKLYGLVEIEDGGESTAVAAIQQFVQNKGDGWSWLLEELHALDAESVPALIDSVSLLGKRTAEMHVALASDAHDHAFAPEEFTSVDADALIKRVIAEMAESVEELAKRLNPDEVEQLHKGLGGLVGGAWSLVGGFKTRVHGDYHLGQTLRTVDDDFVLIDFEGEPSRTMDQRRMKQSPLKDVAGMLRSLDYAAATVTASTADEARKGAIMEWLPRATAAFEDAYRETAGQAAVRIVPSDTQKFREGLNLLIAEKALYEVRYELNNRPDWLSIPLNGIRRLAGIAIFDER